MRTVDPLDCSRTIIFSPLTASLKPKAGPLYRAALGKCDPLGYDKHLLGDWPREEFASAAQAHPPSP